MYGKKVKIKNKYEKTFKEPRIKYGFNLQHSKKVSIDINVVNNGYIINTSQRNTYVFSETEEVIEFIRTVIPMKGTEQDFIDALDDDDEDEFDEDEFDDDSLPF